MGTVVGVLCDPPRESINLSEFAIRFIDCFCAYPASVDTHGPTVVRRRRIGYYGQVEDWLHVPVNRFEVN